MTTREKSLLIKSKAKEWGFSEVGIVKVETLTKEGEQLQAWLTKGYNGGMAYMEDHFQLRTDPSLLFEGAKSVICLSYNYFPKEPLNSSKYKIAKYAYGKDYHKVLRKRIKKLLEELKRDLPEIDGRACVDSAPVMEREWAKRAGLGWYGKNGLIIHPKKGSYFFLAELLVNLELEYDTPISDHCGTCTRCIDACPTDAISEAGYELDASKCLSYLTIELKEDKVPAAFQDKMEDWIFGCDICQDVCPWNKFSAPHSEQKFVPSEALKSMQSDDWENLSQEQFDRLFEGSAVRRTGLEGLKRNIETVRSAIDDV